MATSLQPRPLIDSFYPEPKRRRLQVSEADSYDGPEDKLTFLAHTYEQDRVGCPPLLLLPLTSLTLQHNEEVQMREIYRKYRNPQLQADIVEIIDKYEISVVSRDLELRRVKGAYSSDPVITLYIQTSQKYVFHAAKQRNCVAELYELLRGSKITEGHGVVTVELTGHKYWAPRAIAHLEGGHPFYEVWEKELRKIFLNLLNLSSNIAGKVRSMDLLRYGFNIQHPSQNPIVVSITTDWSIDAPAYQSIKGAMISLLQEAGDSDVQVDFERGEVVIIAEETRAQSPELEMLTTAQAAFPDIRPGSSISNGTAKDPGPCNSLGTVGIVLEIVKVATSEVVATVVLTNHHVVRSCLKGFKPPLVKGYEKPVWSSPDAGSMCAKLDAEGYWAPREKNGQDKYVSQHVFRSPAARVITSSAELAKDALAELKETFNPASRDIVKDAHKKRVAQYQDLIKTLESSDYPVQQLGSVFFSGGLHRMHKRRGGRLDFAGITIEGNALKLASNGISHRAHEWKSNHSPVATTINETNADFGKADPVTYTGEVFKIGAITGCTYGTVRPERVSNISLDWDEPGYWSYEVAIVGAKQGARFPGEEIRVRRFSIPTEAGWGYCLAVKQSFKQISH